MIAKTKPTARLSVSYSPFDGKWHFHIAVWRDGRALCWLSPIGPDDGKTQDEALQAGRKLIEQMGLVEDKDQ